MNVSPFQKKMEVFATKMIKIGDMGMGRAACDFHMPCFGAGEHPLVYPGARILTYPQNHSANTNYPRLERASTTRTVRITGSHPSPIGGETSKGPQFFPRPQRQLRHIGGQCPWSNYPPQVAGSLGWWWIRHDPPEAAWGSNRTGGPRQDGGGKWRVNNVSTWVSTQMLRFKQLGKQTQ